MPDPIEEKRVARLNELFKRGEANRGYEDEELEEIARLMGQLDPAEPLWRPAKRPAPRGLLVRLLERFWRPTAT